MRRFLETTLLQRNYVLLFVSLATTAPSPPHDLVSITVVGKVSESFDVLVSEWLYRQSSPEGDAGDDPADQEDASTSGAIGEAPPAGSGPSLGKLKRSGYLCEMLGLDEDATGDLRYQLLHRTVSALIEAEQFNAPHALMLVHSFSQTGEWFDDYKAFAARLGVEVKPNQIVRVGERARVDLHVGWVEGEAEWLLV